MILAPEQVKYVFTKRERKQGEILYFRKVPKHIRDHFKALCRRKGISVTAMIIHLMRVVTDENFEFNGRAKPRSYQFQRPKYCGIFIRNVPPKLYRKYTALCSLRRTGLTPLMVKLMEDTIEIWNEQLERGIRI